MNRQELLDKVGDLLFQFGEDNENEMVEVMLTITDLNADSLEEQVVFWEEENGEWTEDDPNLFDDDGLTSKDGIGENDNNDSN